MVKYETVSARRTSEENFWHVVSLMTPGLLEDVVTLLKN